ncbi:hypothetical protein JCM3765_003553 [Sporobolomyces pararoseus]
MLSSIVFSLLALTPLALASPVPLQLSNRDELGGIYSGGLARNYLLGGGLFGGDRNRLDLENLRLDKDNQLLAAERNNHLDFDKDTDLDAKNYKETNFDAEKDRAFDNSDSDRIKLIDSAKEQALRKNLKLGGGGFEGIWKRQLDDDAFDFEFDDTSPTTTTTTTSTLPQDGSASTPDSTPTEDDNSTQSPSTPQDEDSTPQDAEDDSGSYNDDSTPPSSYDSSDLSSPYSSTPSDFTPDTSAIEDYQPTSSDDSASTSSPSVDDSIDDSSASSTSPPSRSNDVEPTQALRRRQLDDFDADDLEDEDLEDDDEDSFVLRKRSFGLGGFGGNRFRDNLRFNDAKLLRLAELETARRRKALDLAKVRFNTKNFNDLEFDNNVHLNRDDNAKEIALADGKNLNLDRINKVGGNDFW